MEVGVLFGILGKADLRFWQACMGIIFESTAAGRMEVYKQSGKIRGILRKLLAWE